MKDKGRSWENIKEIIAVIGDGWLGGDEKRLDPGYILQVQPTYYTHEFDVAYERKRGIKNNSIVLGISN